MFEREPIVFGDRTSSHYETQVKWEIQSTYVTKAQKIAQMCLDGSIAGAREVKEATPLTEEQLLGLKAGWLLEIEERKKAPVVKLSPFTVTEIHKLENIP